MVDRGRLQPHDDYNRTQPGRYPPLPDDHPGGPCVICQKPVVTGDVPTLIELAPADEEEAAKAKAGWAHTSVAGIAHERCAWPGEGR